MEGDSQDQEGYIPMLTSPIRMNASSPQKLEDEPRPFENDETIKLFLDKKTKGKTKNDQDWILDNPITTHKTTTEQFIDKSPSFNMKEQESSNISSKDEALKQKPQAKRKRKAPGTKKRGRPRKVDPNEEESQEEAKDKSGLKRTNKEQDKAAKPIDPKRRERNRTLARESRQRKKEYIKSLESEIEQLRSTVGQLRSELYTFKEKEKNQYKVPKMKDARN